MIIEGKPGQSTFADILARLDVIEKQMGIQTADSANVQAESDSEAVSEKASPSKPVATGARGSAISKS